MRTVAPDVAGAGETIVFVSEPALSRVAVEGGDVRSAFPTPVVGRHPRARPAPQG